MTELNPLLVALEHFELALQIYEKDGPCSAVVTLAGVAEEIYGKLAREKGKKSHLQHLIDSCLEVDLAFSGNETLSEKEVAERSKELACRENRVRNFIKHANPAQQPPIAVDMKLECDDMLFRVLANYDVCSLERTASIQRFYAQIFHPMA